MLLSKVFSVFINLPEPVQEVEVEEKDYFTDKLNGHFLEDDEQLDIWLSGYY